MEKTKNISLKDLQIETILANINQLIDNLPSEINDEGKEYTKKLLKSNIEQLNIVNNLSVVNEELKMLFSYQENYLKLIREFKEEIKFLNTTQEDLRKERSKFFSQTLQEVNESLKNSSIDEKTSQVWIQQLVDSYSKSINTSSNLVSSEVTNTVEKMRNKSVKLSEKIKTNK